jgi:hypothetical protein
MQEIQDRRKGVVIPGGYALHEYANLYFHARNPMMYKRCDNHMNLAIIRVNTDVLDLPGTIISDGNASSEYVRFAPSPSGLNVVDSELVFARVWTHPDTFEYWKRKLAKCAEVLVYGRVEPKYLMGVYASSEVSARSITQSLNSIKSNLGVNIDADLYFKN